jgi:arabinofuranosyltransferase
VVLAVAVLAAFVVQVQAWAFLCDDAYISFRYAEHLGRYGMPVFNVVEPPERVEGYTNFSWVVLLALGSALGIEPPSLAPALTVGSSAALLVLSVLLLRSLRDEWHAPLRPLHLSPAVMLVAMPEAMVWSGSGLETSFAAAVVFAAMLAWTRKRLVTAAGLAALAGLTRPDALLPIAMFGLGWIVAEVVKERRVAVGSIPWKRVGLALAAFAGPLGVHLLWRHAYYGAWVPNTWPIKAHGMLLRETYGQAYVDAWIEHVHLWWAAPLLLLLRPRHTMLVLPTAAVVGYGWYVGGDFMAYSRFYLVATAGLATLIAWLLADLASILRPRLGARASWVALGVVVLTAGLLGRDARARHAHDVEQGGKWIDGKWEGTEAMDRFARVGRAAGAWMHEHLPADTWITVGAAGAVPYGAKLPTIDAYGLVDPVIATLPEAGPYTGKGARPGHQLQAPRKYIRSRDPDMLCHVGYRGPRAPSERRQPRGYARGYRWACIDLPEILDRHGEPMPAGVYCCRRPLDRVVGPFGEAE